MIDEASRRALLKLARDAIAAHVAGAPAPAPDDLPVLTRHAGVFVSLHKADALRGCIGHVEPSQPLGRSIPSAAVAAATDDPRFAPVTAAELSDLHLEVSILGPLEAIAGSGDVEVGRHGLLIEQDGRRGLLLPQVAVEWNWDAETFLAQTCHKAGLPPDAWTQSGASLWRFEAEVFSEA